MPITRIVVAHRPALIRRATRVFHVEGGKATVRQIGASSRRAAVLEETPRLIPCSYALGCHPGACHRDPSRRLLRRPGWLDPGHKARDDSGMKCLRCHGFGLPGAGRSDASRAHASPL